MAEVIQIEGFRLSRRRHRAAGNCKHDSLTLHDDGEYVTCDACGVQVGNFAALRMVLERWIQIQDAIDHRMKVAKEAADLTLGLRAAKKLEVAWRSRSSVPTCPHCEEAIFPGDGLGGSGINREVALRRRQAATAGCVSRTPQHAPHPPAVGQDQGEPSDG